MNKNIEIIEYKPEHKKLWEEFIDNSNNGTIFHYQKFLDYHTPGKFDFTHYLFLKNDKLVALLPGGINKKNEYWSPVGASYGSIVTKDIHFELALEIVDSFIDFCKEKKINGAYLIPAPLIYNINYSQHLEYAMLYRKCDFELHYISHAIDLKHKNDFLKHFDKTSRKEIHRIFRENKLTIRESDDFESFNQILLNNKARHNVKPTHTLEDMIRLKELFPKEIKLNLVYYEDKPIAGSLLFVCNKKVVICFYNMLLYEYQHLKPIYLIMYETVRWAVEHKFEWVDIGVSQDTSAEDPMTPSINLINFKERFDSRGILRSTFHFDFNK